MITLTLSALQIAVGLTILLAGYLMAAAAMDDDTHASVRWPMVGLNCWAVWFAMQPLAGAHDSPPSIAMAALVAYVLVRHRGIVLVCLGLSVKGMP